MYLADQILNAPPLVLAVEMNVYPASFREMVEATLDNLDFQGVGVGARDYGSGKSPGDDPGRRARFGSMKTATWKILDRGNVRGPPPGRSRFIAAIAAMMPICPSSGCQWRKSARESFSISAATRRRRSSNAANAERFSP